METNWNIINPFMRVYEAKPVNNQDDNDNVIVDDNTVMVNGIKYEKDGNDIKSENGEKLTDIESQQFKRIINNAEELKDLSTSAEHERITGQDNNGELRKKLDNINPDPISDEVLHDSNRTMCDFIKNHISAKYDSTYVPLPNNSNNNLVSQVFGVTQHQVGKGEVLLPLLYCDLRRHDLSEKGDDVTINGGEKTKKEFELKSAGTSLPIQTTGIDSDEKKNNVKYVLAFSIARYIKRRNIGEIYLVIFDNTLKNSQALNTDSEKNKINNMNHTQSANELGSNVSPSGFFIMNCGESVSPHGEAWKDESNELAVFLYEKIEVDGDITEIPVDAKRFIFYYQGGKDGKIHCVIPGKHKNNTKGDGK